ncbi:MAG: hypothetical protein ACREFI_14530, partial [Stellaceae bacterium]
MDIGALGRGPAPVEASQNRHQEANPRAEATPVYFINAWLDGAMIGGLSIALFALLRLGYTGEKTATIVKLAGILSIFINYPHFSATLYRL